MSCYPIFLDCFLLGGSETAGRPVSVAAGTKSVLLRLISEATQKQNRISVSLQASGESQKS